jgi:hypothetical protein
MLLPAAAWCSMISWFLIFALYERKNEKRVKKEVPPFPSPMRGCRLA